MHVIKDIRNSLESLDYAVVSVSAVVLFFSMIFLARRNKKKAGANQVENVLEVCKRLNSSVIDVLEAQTEIRKELNSRVGEIKRDSNLQCEAQLEIREELTEKIGQLQDDLIVQGTKIERTKIGVQELKNTELYEKDHKDVLEKKLDTAVARLDDFQASVSAELERLQERMKSLQQLSLERVETPRPPPGYSNSVDLLG